MIRVKAVIINNMEGKKTSTVKKSRVWMLRLYSVEPPGPGWAVTPGRAAACANAGLLRRRIPPRGRRIPRILIPDVLVPFALAMILTVASPMPVEANRQRAG